MTAYDASTVTVLHDGTITVLDQTICVPVPVPGSGPHPLGGTQGRPVGRQSGELLDTGCGRSALTATDATFTNIDIGRDAQNALNHYVPAAGQPDATGLFSQSANSVSIDGLTQVSIGTSASTFTVPGLSLSATFVTACP